MPGQGDQLPAPPTYAGYSSATTSGIIQQVDHVPGFPGHYQLESVAIAVIEVTSAATSGNFRVEIQQSGQTLTATFLRQQLDALAPGAAGNAGDALNLGEAGSIGADLFVTADKNTIGRAFGLGGSIFLPHSGGVSLPFVVVQ